MASAMANQDVPLHRVRGLVSGVNWRVTKFAAAVPPLLSCGLCRVISQTTFLLPCFHNLCDSCLSNCAKNGNPVCPFDELQFAVRECHEISSPPDAIAKLKACCWNESYGCTFVGTPQDVLTHYEDQCTFHVVSCTICNGPVLHQDLPRHYRSGCHCGAISLQVEQLNLHERPTLSADDIASSLNQLKALILDPPHDRLPEFQSTLNEVLEEAKNIGDKIEAVTTAVTDNQTRLTKTLGELAATFHQQLRSQLHALSDHLASISDLGRSDACEAGTMSTTEVSWRLEKKHILRRLELMATDSHAYLDLLRQRSDQQLQQPAAEYETVFPSASGYTSVGMLPFMGKLECQDGGYVVGLTNVDNLIKNDNLIGLFTRWYRRDQYLQVAAKGSSGSSLYIYLKFGKTIQRPRSTPNDAEVRVSHPDFPGKHVALRKAPTGALTEAGRCGFQQEFFAEMSYLGSSGFMKDDRMTLVITF